MDKKELNDEFKSHVFFPRTKIDPWTLRRLRSLKSKCVGHRGWSDFFKYITKDVSLEPTLHERVMEGTANALLETWMVNFANNLPYIRNGDDIKIEVGDSTTRYTIADIIQPPPVFENEADFSKQNGPVENCCVVPPSGIKVRNPPKSAAIIVGRGPSLFKNDHPKKLAAAIENGDYKGKVIASDGALIPLLEAGCVPDAVVTVDGAKIIKKFFEAPIVKQYGSKIAWIVASTVNHDVYLTGINAGLHAFWFNPTFDDWRQNESWTKIQKLLTRKEVGARGNPNMQCGGCAGNASWIVAMDIFKCSPVGLVGMDAGYPEGTKLEDTQYFSAVLKEANGDIGLIKRAYQEFYHPFWKTRAFVDTVFYHYRQALIEMQKQTDTWYRVYGGTINITMGGTLFGPGITCMNFDDFIQKYGNVKRGI